MLYKKDVMVVNKNGCRNDDYRFDNTYIRRFISGSCRPNLNTECKY
jgi:hypothetical protein